MNKRRQSGWRNFRATTPKKGGNPQARFSKERLAFFVLGPNNRLLVLETDDFALGHIARVDALSKSEETELSVVYVSHSRDQYYGWVERCPRQKRHPGQGYRSYWWIQSCQVPAMLRGQVFRAGGPGRLQFQFGSVRRQLAREDDERGPVQGI